MPDISLTSIQIAVLIEVLKQVSSNLDPEYSPEVDIETPVILAKLVDLK